MAYKKKGIVFPRCTAIIADCTPKNWGIQWGSNCVVEWIKENVTLHTIYKTPIYLVSNEALNKARFAHNDISKQARDIGSEVHNAVEKHLMGAKYALTTKEAENAFGAFLKWKDTVSLTPIYLERTVWGNRWAGTLDIDCLLNNKRYIIDIKTSKSIYLSEMGVQLAAYRSCVPGAVGNGVLRLDKLTGEFEWKDFSKRYESDLAVWEAMLVLYFAKHPRIRARFEK